MVSEMHHCTSHCVKHSLLLTLEWQSKFSSFTWLQLTSLWCFGSAAGWKVAYKVLSKQFSKHWCRGVTCFLCSSLEIDAFVCCLNGYCSACCVVSEWCRSIRWRTGQCMTSCSGTQLPSSWRLLSVTNCSRVCISCVYVQMSLWSVCVVKGGAENARLGNVGLELSAPNCRGWKMRD